MVYWIVSWYGNDVHWYIWLYIRNLGARVDIKFLRFVPFFDQKVSRHFLISSVDKKFWAKMGRDFLKKGRICMKFSQKASKKFRWGQFSYFPSDFFSEGYRFIIKWFSYDRKSVWFALSTRCTFFLWEHFAQKSDDSFLGHIIFLRFWRFHFLLTGSAKTFFSTLPMLTN